MIASLLSDGSIAVRIDAYLSNYHTINDGVPQDSVISMYRFYYL